MQPENSLFPLSQKKLLVIADSHLGMKEGDVEKIQDFIRSLDPKIYALLFMGDIFHIWAGPGKYHNDGNIAFLETLKEYRKKGGTVCMCVGNRDLLFPEISQYNSKIELPFDRVARDFAFLGLGGKTILIIHGDTVNTQDKQYLRWRKIVRSGIFRFLVGLIPRERVKRLMIEGEAKMKKTNSSFRLHFPREEWEDFLQRVNRSFSPHLLLIGHFHPKEPIVSQCKETTGIVTPDWLGDCSYLEIDSSLHYSHHHFSSSP